MRGDFNPFLALILLSWASARITRLVFKDALFDEPRRALTEWLKDPVKVRRHKRVGGIPWRPRLAEPEILKRHWLPYWVRAKIGYMITCPYCISAYTTAAVLLGYRIWVEPFTAPVLWWLAVWFGAIIGLEYTDGEK